MNEISRNKTKNCLRRLTAVKEESSRSDTAKSQPEQLNIFQKETTLVHVQKMWSSFCVAFLQKEQFDLLPIPILVSEIHLLVIFYAKI